MDRRNVVKQRWVAAISAAGGDPAIAEPLGDELVAHYSDSDRHYHNLAHVDQVTSDIAALAAECGLDQRETTLVVLAGLAHDVIYDARPGEDERRSAQWVADALTRCAVAPDVVDGVVDLVRATADHQSGSTLGGQVLMDADLAILGSPPASYREYVQGVRAEYASFDDAVWALGRTHVLQSLLDRRTIFETEPARRRWEDAARRNLTAELEVLNDAPS